MYKLPIKEMLKRKRQDGETTENETKRSKHVTPNDDKLKFVNLPATKKERQAIAAAAKQFPQTDATDKVDSSQEKKPPMKKRKLEGGKSQTTDIKEEVVEVSSDDEDDDDAPKEVPISRQTTEVIDVDKYSKKLKRKNKRKFNSRQRSQHPQSSNKPIQLMKSKPPPAPAPPAAATSSTNFDYKNVDFMKFKGGAQKAKAPELKSDVRGKGNSNKSQNKKFNKLFTFSNVKNKKK